MGRLKRHALPLSHGDYLRLTMGLTPSARCIFLELVWYCAQSGDELPVSDRSMANIARVYARNWSANWTEIRHLFTKSGTGYWPRCLPERERIPHGNPAETQALSTRQPTGNPAVPASGGKAVENLLAEGGNPSPGTERSVPVRTPGSVPVRSTVTESTLVADAPLLPEPPVVPLNDSREMAIWLLRSVLAERPGRTRGDHLRDAIFAKASATWPVDGPEKNAAVTLAWNAKFWLTVQEIQTRVAPEQPADQDPGHPELELWWHQEAFP